MEGVCGQALPLPELPAHWAGCWGPPPKCCGRGRVGVGARHCFLGLHALWRLRAAGVVGGRPRGGWPATVVWGVWCEALSLSQPPALWGGRPGFCNPCDPGAVGAGVGTQHQPHSVRLCGPALLAVGVAEGRPQGGCLPPLRGASGVRRCPSPGRRFSGAGSQGSATRVSRVRSVRAWGPSTGPTACALAGRRCSLWGWRKGILGGGAFHHSEGRLRSGAVPPPTARPLGGLLGSATHVLWARVCGCGVQHCPLGFRVHALWGLRAAGVVGGPSPGGGGLLPM